MRAGGLDQVELGEDVRLEGALQLLHRDVGNVLVGMLFARGVDQHVDPAPFLDHLFDQRLARFRIAQVTLVRQRLAALVADARGGEFGVVAFFEIGDGDLGAFAGEQDGGGAADTTVTAGDDGHLALQPARAGVARLPFGLVVHLRFVPRHAGFFARFFDEGGVNLGFLAHVVLAKCSCHKEI